MRQLLQQQQSTPPLSPEAQELLAQLRDIREPAPISWWPPAPGWWLLALLLLACATVIFLWLRHKRRQKLHNRYRVEAVRLLEEIDTADPVAPQEINELLKRVAVTSYGRTTCGNLTGQAWLEFLQVTAVVDCTNQVRQVVLQHLYRKDTTDAAGNEAFRDYAMQWVQGHGDTFPAAGQTAAEASRV
ncbi:DUF4381 domain-containing protein [Microbulbifer taiwanensis]|uniref:DUF4381 domain-containing protein n=1 Tax=Microbulbifer taiwanensis TaxID=986746 RepID=A0ABW1YRX1_9GAMM|nr:DUF4381 domain-containing protein [Microbulbifer taiwanensis]